MGNAQETNGWQTVENCISLCSYMSLRQGFITEEKHTRVGTGCFGISPKSSVGLRACVGIAESRHFLFTAPAPRVFPENTEKALVPGPVSPV